MIRLNIMHVSFRSVVLPLVLLSLMFLGGVSRADTEVECIGFGEGKAEGFTVQYSHWSFQPCDGPCPKMVEPMPVIEIKRQIEADVAEVTTLNQVEFKILKKRPKITRSKRVIQKLNSNGKNIGEPSTRFFREEKFEAVIHNKMIPEEGVRVQCTKKIDSAKFI
jgi:hypothetical protein